MGNEPWFIRLFGTLSASQAETKIDRFRSQKAGALLACLALPPERLHMRAELVEMLWPDSTLEAGQVSLRVALFSLRRLLEPQESLFGTVISADRRSVGLVPEAFTTDVAEFRQALDRAGETPGSPEAFAHYTHAVHLYRGELLPGYYEDWVLTERNRLAGAYVGALERLVRYHAEQENWQEAIEMAWRGIQADPLLESAYRDLMRLYIALKRPGEARTLYELLERRLRDALGASPSRATRRLIESLASLPSTCEGSAPALSPDAAATPVGQTPTLPSSPVPESLAETPPFRIPASLSYFFGREEQIAQLTVLLLPSAPLTRASVQGDPPALRDGQGDGARLVTLTGPGGTGKTRLALEVGSRLQAQFAGGAAFVSLAHLQDPRLLVGELQEALGVPRHTPDHPLDDVITALGRRPTLLILDNLELFVESAALIVRDLLGRLPSLVCLTTSRRSLGVPGEREFPVSSLELPESGAPLDTIRGSASVQLFLDRARSVQPDFRITAHNYTDIATLCQRLDGMPLAIELAATHVRGLAPAQMLALLTDRFQLLVDRRAGKDSRHRSLRTTIEWSLQLLPLETRRFFACLSVFRGGWDLEAANAICLETRDRVTALDLLEQLRIDSMIQTHSNGAELRFQMLESLREFGGGMLSPGERETLTQHHADYFFVLVKSRLTDCPALETAGVFELLDRENDNLRATLNHLLSAGEPQRNRGLLLAIALTDWWRSRAAFREGGDWMERALAAAPADLPALDRARALYASGKIALGRGDNSAARDLFQSGRALLQGLDAKALLLGILLGLAASLQMLNELESAESLLLESISLAQELKDPVQIASALFDLGSVRWNQGDLDGARACYLEVQQRTLSWESKPTQAAILQHLALLECMADNGALARSYCDAALALTAETHTPIVTAFGLLGLGLIECAESLFDLSEASLRQSLRILVGCGERRILLLVFHALARVALQRNRPQRAVRLLANFRAMQKLFHPDFKPGAYTDQMYLSVLTPARDALSEAEFQLVWRQGSVQSYEEMVAYALADPD